VSVLFDHVAAVVDLHRHRAHSESFVVGAIAVCVVENCLDPISHVCEPYLRREALRAAGDRLNLQVWWSGRVYVDMQDNTEFQCVCCREVYTKPGRFDLPRCPRCGCLSSLFPEWLKARQTRG
jgi:hypothetical protein